MALLSKTLMVKITASAVLTVLNIKLMKRNFSFIKGDNASMMDRQRTDTYKNASSFEGHSKIFQKFLT